MMLLLSAFIVGTLFGVGLALSQMTNPERVIGFLDITGRWDPTLALVMAGALIVTLPGFYLVLRRGQPVIDRQFHLPTQSKIDRRLLFGAALFGVGWGLAGMCPGPALAALVSGQTGLFLFVGAMIAGQWLASRITRHY
jgi:uncharacterized membrane protein YedE/YeeE